MNEQLKKLRIVFMGTPEFAVESLKALINDGQKIVAVITAPDKPAGRGRLIQSSPVKDFALKNKLLLLQPPNLKSEEFVKQINQLHPDLQVVVAFRMLPEQIWEIPQFGTINLHASLLPQYRGAAPINWAIINGEKYTGVTTFFINNEIDTGDILFQEKVEIMPSDDAGTLHDKLMYAGAQLLVRTVNAIAAGNYRKHAQNRIPVDEVLKSAPKIKKEVCRINWKDDVEKIYNFVRGLSPYPAAWSMLSDDTENIQTKIFVSEIINEPHKHVYGTVMSDGKTYLKVAAQGGFVFIKELQLAGKKRLNVVEFLKGFKNIINYKFY
jgi:methionyl-tRNA formyltransferase